MSRTVFDFDELNVLKLYLQTLNGLESIKKGMPQEIREEIEDSFLDILIMEFIYGSDDASKALRLDKIERDNESLISSMEQSIYKTIDGKTVKDRIAEYCNSGDMSALTEVLDTEAGRNYNSGVDFRGNKALKDGVLSNIKKTWHTMLDSKVRDQHQYLEGVTVGFNEEFYTYTGDHAPYPKAFGVASEDCNCRCYITLSRG